MLGLEDLQEQRIQSVERQCEEQLDALAKVFSQSRKVTCLEKLPLQRLIYDDAQHCNLIRARAIFSEASLLELMEAWVNEFLHSV